MKNIIERGYDEIVTRSCEGESILGTVAGAIPSGLAKPLLDHQRIKYQKELIEKVIEANKQTKADLMHTLRELASQGQLTPEIVGHIFAAYNQALIQYPN